MTLCTHARTQAEDDHKGMKARFASVRMGALINGKEHGLESIVQLPIESEDDLLYPGASMARAEAVTFNFGYRPLRYAQGGWVSVAEALPSWEQLKAHVPFPCVPYPVATPLHLAAAAAAGNDGILETLFASAAPGTAPPLSCN
jgi:hypothetical protein